MSAPTPLPTDERVYESYLKALLEGDRAECLRVVESLSPGRANIEEIYRSLFERSLYEVGQRWEKHRISVAVEHRATAITSSLLTSVGPVVFDGGPRRSRSIIVACVAGELHQIGARMVADLCELHGWRGHLLGSRTSRDELLRAIEERRPSILGFSLALLTNLPSLLDSMDAVRVAYPRLPIVVGGQAFRHGGQAVLASYGNVSYVASFAELSRRLASFEPDADAR